MAKILIVEDQQIFQNLYQAIFERENFEIVAAYDGEEGLNLAGEHQPDLILLDLMMPKVDGIEFLKRYKPRDHPETKVIVFSNAEIPELMQAADELGAFKFLVKATFFTPKQLLATVWEALDEKPTRKKSASKTKTE